MKKYFLPVLAFCLILIFFLSFLKGKSVSSEDFQFISDPLEISIRKNEGQFTLFKENGIWKGEAEGIIIPVEQNLVEDGLKNLKATQNLYSVSDFDEKKLFEYGLDFSSAFQVTLNNGSEKQSFVFGKNDFSTLNRFCLLEDGNSESQNRIWKFSSDGIEQFFHTEGRFWIDPYLIPRTLFESGSVPLEIDLVRITKNGKTLNLIPGQEVDYDGSHIDAVSRLQELRHGPIFTGKITGTPVADIHVQFNNSKNLNISVYRHSDTDFVLNYRTGDGAYGQWNYSVTASSWTMNQVTGF